MQPETYDPNFHGDYSSHRWLPKLHFRALGKTGLELCTLGIGGSSFGNFYGENSLKGAKETVVAGLKAGLNYIDTSPWYQESERYLGEVLRDIPRNTYYIGTKAGRNSTETWENRFDFSASAVLKNVENSLKLLGIPYLDIIQVHDVEFSLNIDQIINETIPTLESVVRAGKAKYIGITGYDLDFMEKISKECSIHSILSYCRFNLHDTSLNDYIPHLESKNIGVINASATAMGLFSSAGPPAWHAASDEVKNVAKDASKIAQKYGQTIEDASTGFTLRPENKNIATTLACMPTEEILEKNLKVVTSPITAQDLLMYNEIQQSFKDRISGPTHWAGVEIAEYKKSIASKVQ